MTNGLIVTCLLLGMLVIYLTLLLSKQAELFDRERRKAQLLNDRLLDAGKLMDALCDALRTHTSEHVVQGVIRRARQ